MPDLNDLNTFLKADMCETGDTIKFLNAGRIFSKDFPQKDGSTETKVTFEVSVLLNGEKTKTYSPNNSSLSFLKEAWGNNSDDWVGRRAEISIVEQLSFGKVRKVIIARPIGSSSKVKTGQDTTIASNSPFRPTVAQKNGNVDEDINMISTHEEGEAHPIEPADIDFQP